MSKIIQGCVNHRKKSGFYSTGNRKPTECFITSSNLIHGTDHNGCSVVKEWGDSMWELLCSPGEKMVSWARMAAVNREMYSGTG